MAVSIVIKAEKGSLYFPERIIVLEASGTLRVSRCGREEKPNFNNAIFDSRVLSKPHAIISRDENQVFITDCGSSNGTFINNIRLSTTNKKSKKVEIFSEDILRFGSSVVDSKKMRSVEKCIVGKITILDENGLSLERRPLDNKFCATTLDAKKKQVSFQSIQDTEYKSKGDGKVDSIIFRSESEMSESQMLRAQLEALRLSELSNELNTVKTLLRKTQEEFSDLKEQSKIDKEHLIARGREADELKTRLERYSIGASEENNQLELCKSELRRQAEALDKLNEMFSESEEILTEKEVEISSLNETIAQNRLEIEDKENEYINLKCLMVEENETIHQIDCQMKHLMDVIVQDQDIIKSKEKQIHELQDNLDKKEKTATDIHDILEEKDLEIEKFVDKKEFELFNARLKLEEYNQCIADQQLEIEGLENMLEHQTELAKTHDILRNKMSDLMNIIDKQNVQIASLNEKEAVQESLSKRHETLQKEFHVLKVTLQQKDLDIKSLNSLIESKEEALQQKDEMLSIQLSNISSEGKKESKAREEELQLKQEIIKSLEGRIVKEQKNNEDTEAELIKLKIEFDNLQMNRSDLPVSSEEKSAEIENIMIEIRKEREVVAHIQMIQEKEIIEMEKEISFLRQALDNRQNQHRPRSRAINKQTNVDEYDDEVSESNTVTFHDALGSEDDVSDLLLDDLECD